MEGGCSVNDVVNDTLSDFHGLPVWPYDRANVYGRQRRALFENRRPINTLSGSQQKAPALRRINRVASEWN